MPSANSVVTRDGDDGVWFWKGDIANLTRWRRRTSVPGQVPVAVAMAAEQERTILTSESWPCS